MTTTTCTVDLPSTKVATTNDEKKPSPPPPQQQNDEYAINHYTMSYKNPATELRYCNFSYIHSGFYGGKIWHILSIGGFVQLMILFHKLGLTANFWDKIIEPSNLLIDFSIISTILTFVCLFVERLYPYREHLLLVSFASHWPALAVQVSIGKRPQTLSYPVCLVCYFFCAFISQIRFCRLFPFLAVTPLLTLIVLVSTQSSYFETHAVTEIAFWPSVFFPLILLRAFEVRYRKSFETVENSERHIQDLGLKIEMAHQTVANFFPPTPTIDLLLPPSSTVAAPLEQSPSGESPGWTPLSQETSNTDETDESEELRVISGSPAKRYETKKLAWSTSFRNSTTSMQYRDCAMIVTDLAGFTQWTSSCAHDPSIVITLLTKMFLNIDHIMPLYNVEKVATVGDAFIGLIFSRDGRDIDMTNSTSSKIGLRASHAMQFGCDILNTASSASAEAEHSLKMRVGVHIGDLVGGFVGTSPPKFDIFGRDFEKAKVMESSGRPDHVHASREVVVAYQRAGASSTATSCARSDDPRALLEAFCTSAPSYERTKLGVLCPEWVFPSSNAVLDDDVDDGSDDHVHGGGHSNQLQAMISSNAIGICEKLIKMRHDASDNVEEEIIDDGAPIPLREKTPHVVVLPDAHGEATSLLNAHEEGPDEQVDDKDLDFSVIWLEFSGKSTERHFRATMLSGDLLTSSYFILGLLQFVMVFAHAMNGCVDSVSDRLVLSACLALTTCWLAFVHLCGVKTLLGVGLIIGCSILTYVVSVFQTTECGTRGVVGNVANVIINYYILAAVATQFALNIVLKYRLLMLLATTSVVYITYPLRMTTVGTDGVFAVDMNLAFYAVAFCVLTPVSYFVDFSQRSAFSSSRKLHRLLVSARGKHADTATQAMDIMLPSFVCDALTHTKKDHSSKDDAPPRDSQDGVSSESSHLTGGITSTSGSSGGEIDLEVLRDGMVWEYPTVVVMFIKFVPTHSSPSQQPHLLQADRTSFSTSTNHSSAPSAAVEEDMRMSMTENYDEINACIMELERVIAKCNVQKVKTIGNTLMAVAGIDETCTEPYHSMLQAALEAQGVLAQRAEFTIGISSGACFGAVIGVKGLCFDIFGDTVNTASRMCTTAADGSIQLTDQTRLSALALEQVPSRATLCPVTNPVVVQGKGAMNVYTLVRL